MSGRLRSALTRVRAVVGIAIAQLRHDRTRTVLSVLGITLAVLATTLLGGVGIGVVETGEEQFDASGRDLWVTGGPITLAPGTVGGFENTVVDAHEISAAIESREDVSTAVPMAFQTVYVSTDGEDWETLVGTGAPGRGPSVQVTEGQAFQNRDIHYADGNYTGPMTHEVIIDQRTADMFNVSVGDTLHIGGTISDARANEFTVVGISPTFSRFLGTPTVTLHLSELQEVTGTTATDRASLITVDLKDGADPATVAQEIEREHPEYEVRTNREQLEATLERQAVVLASGGSLVVLAVLAGITLTANLLVSVVYQQRRELAALKALGSRTRTLVGIVVVQALFLGVIGGLLGVAATIPLGMGLDAVAASLVGFENVVRTPPWVLGAGVAIAVPISLIGAAVAGWQVSRLSPVDGLR
ncbi:lipoprotein releasing system, transmembrane protein, LolC/E family [Halolamina pelagica]|uniref:Lipoprotein releasing system, transmembrane protein, LolC/E family n=1 Tax=Halolamina pelagica TaxID=699431 RepID=A0A0P7GSA4_9EURY|nr:ABC transporter permease [Halolamina pelagica]KPN32312.1 lipoprotein releasing system, transmembrane protein, LolC/E family [Halolamina pelagica]